FTLLALQGFGGVMAVVQREMVERKRWLTQEEFIEDWAVAQIMPGPNVVNLSLMIGGRYFGLPGALAALAGLLGAPPVVVLLLSAMSLGGAISTSSEMHRFLVEQHHWISQGQFNQSITLAQAAPGPNVLFVALMGWHVGMNAGSTGAALFGVLVTMVGIMTPSTLIT